MFQFDCGADAPYRTLFRLAFFVCLAGLAIPSKAGIVYINFGPPGDLYLTGNSDNFPAGIVTLGRLTYRFGTQPRLQVAVFEIAADSSGVPASVSWNTISWAGHRVTERPC
jgi:hypothetical protein